MKKGEKALWILAPIQKKMGEDENKEPIYKIWFKRVPVFDISQTEGEAYNVDYTENELNLTFDEIKTRTSIPIVITNEQITQGKTDGETIWISNNFSNTQKICTLFHEMAHYYLHFDEFRKEIKRPHRELEAESVAFMISTALNIKNDESSAYIKLWAGENSPKLIKGVGGKLIRVAQKIIDDMNLREYVEAKTKLNRFYGLKEENNWGSIEAWDFFENRLIEGVKLTE